MVGLLYNRLTRLTRMANKVPGSSLLWDVTPDCLVHADVLEEPASFRGRGSRFL
jgi:hypothetical protein